MTGGMGNIETDLRILHGRHRLWRGLGGFGTLMIVALFFFVRGLIGGAGDQESGEPERCAESSDPLIRAASWGSVDTVTILLAVDQADPDRETRLTTALSCVLGASDDTNPDQASESAREEIADLLIEAGAREPDRES